MLIQKYLEANAEGFPLAEHTTRLKGVDEIVPLSETSNVLELLFQFTYPQMPPDLDNLEFPELMEVAEAAEKYFVHHARKLCLYPLEIFAFAAEHDHKKMLYEVAPLLVFKPLSEIAYRIPSSIYVPWSLYHDQFTSNMWKEALDSFHQPDLFGCSGDSNHATYWRRVVKDWKVKICNDPALLLTDLDKSLDVDPKYKGQCCNAFVNWWEGIKNKFKLMNSFEYFVKQHRAKMSGRVF
ncbi:hypothetical protein D9758_016714 [Tetrapyrgos nigripes]|uniref:BTB domain-containing protein n=1 Tax=Tetrapyrgos nigripes TaxID=182062 RepID=A0A8H5BRD5_9AGAR|nr:hypothetical protein D9758_016714 [Tetrapyrgos nigripes]